MSVVSAAIASGRSVASGAMLPLCVRRTMFNLYKIGLHQSEEGLSASVPGMLGCWSRVTTKTEAIENIKDAMGGYLDMAQEQLRDDRLRQIEILV